MSHCRDQGKPIKSKEDFASFVAALLTMDTGQKNSFLTFATMDQEFENRKKEKEKKKTRTTENAHTTTAPFFRNNLSRFCKLTGSDTSDNGFLCNSKCFLDNGFPKQPQLFLPAHWTPDTTKKEKRKKKKTIYRWGNQKFERRRWIGVKKDSGMGNGSERGGVSATFCFFPLRDRGGVLFHFSSCLAD